MDLAMALAAERGADLVVANDPDADRCAAAVPDAARLADAARRRGRRAARRPPAAPRASRAPTRARSSPRRCSASWRPRHGQPYVETLTGFKWIGRVEGLAFGYEEALGYCVDPEHVKDKDGVSALLLLCELAALREGRAAGPSTDVLDDIAAEHGLHATDQLSVRVERPVAHRRRRWPGCATHAADRARRAAPSRPSTTCPWARPALPPTDGLRYRLADGARVIVRPSGTEPKLKCYLEVVVPVDPDDGVDAARIAAAGRLDALRADIKARRRHLTRADLATARARPSSAVSRCESRASSAGARLRAGGSDDDRDARSRRRSRRGRRSRGQAHSCRTGGRSALPIRRRAPSDRRQDPVAHEVGVAGLQRPSALRPAGGWCAGTSADRRARRSASRSAPHRQHLAHRHLRRPRPAGPRWCRACCAAPACPARRGPRAAAWRRTTRSRRTPRPSATGAPETLLAVDERPAPSRPGTAAPRAHPSRGRWWAGSSRCSRRVDS